jgi:hypothetical protein
MSSFVNQSSYALLSFLNEWISVKENCVLNSAFSNSQTRLKLTNILQFSCGLVTRPKDSRFIMTLLVLKVTSAFIEQHKSGSYAVYKPTEFNSPLEIWDLITKEGMTNLITHCTSLRQLKTAHTMTNNEDGTSVMAFWSEFNGNSKLSIKCESLESESTDTRKSEILGRTDLKYSFGSVSAAQFWLDKLHNVAVTYNRRNDHQRWGGEMLTYCGKWDVNGCHGYGKCIYVDGSTYEGDWNCNLRSGFGTMVFLRTFWGTDTYTGQWLLNVQHGHGHFSSAFYEYCYDGEWEEGEMYGHGVILWNTGETMVGVWDGTLTSMAPRSEDDLPCELRLLNGDVYRGRFLRGFIHGDGLVLYSNGDKLDGAFRMEKQCKSCNTPQMSCLCTCTATTGRWFDRLRLIVGTFAKHGEEEPVWDDWQPPERTEDGEWSAGGIPYKR